MHDEKNRKEAEVITVASKKDTKERGNIMENKKKSFNLKKFKKDVQGITLIALVVTMVLHYDKVKKCSNSNSFLLSSI